MATKNDITGDSIQTKATTDAYRDNYDRIFGKTKTSHKLYDLPKEIIAEIIEDIAKYKVHEHCHKCGIELTQPLGYSCSKADCPVFVQFIC